MENQKDIQNNTQENSSNGSRALLSVFNNDAEIAYIYKKTERLSTALYLITNFFSDSEPLKWNIRSAVSIVLKDIITRAGGSSGSFISALSDAKKHVLHLLALIDIAHASGIMSPMNHSILDREFAGLLALIEKRISVNFGGTNSSTLSEAFFKVQEIKNLPIAKKEEIEEVSVKDNSRTSGQTNIVRNIAPTKIQNLRTLVTEPVRNSKPAVSDKSDQSGLVEQKKSKRVSAILSLVQKKTRVTVKDVADVVTGCSEKTLQRELLALVSEGVLKKEGERRWSTYSLV